MHMVSHCISITLQARMRPPAEASLERKSAATSSLPIPWLPIHDRTAVVSERALVPWGTPRSGADLDGSHRTLIETAQA